ncbi:MAG: alpha/beta fold hydrolase, partial [Sciscionella sp.]
MPTDLAVEVAGVTLVVRAWPAEEPAGCPPVVLVPATAETAQDWDRVASALSATRAVYAINLRGHGPSDWPGTYSIGLLADDVIGLLDGRLGREPVDLVGHSLGGLVACRVAAARPDLVGGLVLEDVGLLAPRPAATPPRPAGVLPFDWRVVEQVRPEIDDFDPGWAAVMATITAPTLVVAGGPRSPIPREKIADLVRLLPDGRMVTVDAGHLVHAAEPDVFIRHLMHFLDIWPIDSPDTESVHVAAADRDRIEVVRRGYDAVSLLYRPDDADAAQYTPWITELLTALGTHARVLDIGCGCGIPVARDLVRAGHDVTGVDISDRQIERARRLVPEATFIRADATQVRFESRSFDAAVALYSLIHMPLDRQLDLLHSLADVLVEGGLLLLTAG